MPQINPDEPVFPFVNIETVILEKLQIASQQHLSKHALMGARVDVVREAVDEMVVQLKAYVWSEQLDRQEIKYPRDWRQAFKERWFPDWAKRRWPVVYTHHIFDLKAIYPDIKVSVPEHHHQLRWVKMK